MKTVNELDLKTFPAMVGSYVTQMDNFVCNLTFTVTLSSCYIYRKFSYNIHPRESPTFLIVTIPNILRKT